MRTNRKGFSIIELMVAIVVIGVLAAATVPNMITGIPKYRVKSAATDLSAKLRRARWAAVKEGRQVTVAFNQATGNYVVDGQLFPHTMSITNHYGSGVTYSYGSVGVNALDSAEPMQSKPILFDTGGGANDDEIIFATQGTANAGVVYFKNNRSDIYAVVVRSTGVVTVRKWMPADGAWNP